MVTALLLEARARDALGEAAAAGRVLERALDITESTGIVLPFLLDPVPALSSGIAGAVPLTPL